MYVTPLTKAQVRVHHPKMWAGDILKRTCWKQEGDLTHQVEAMGEPQEWTCATKRRCCGTIAFQQVLTHPHSFGDSHMGVSIDGGTPKWLVYFRENPIYQN